MSEAGKSDLSANESLVYPMDIGQPITATAYVISNKAARNMLNAIKPIRVTADSWHYYYHKGTFTSLRVLYPTSFGTKYFKSSIDYYDSKSAKGILSHFVNKHKILVLFQILKYLRAKRQGKMLNHFNLTKEVSPIYNKLKLRP